jgi:hypothetical protein
MKRIVQVICIAALLAVSAAANATLVTWRVQGHLTEADGGPPDFLVNNPFTLLINFDAAASLNGTQVGDTGFRYSYNANSLSFDLFAGTTCNPCHRAATDPGSSGIIFLRDNFSLAPGFPAPIDGYTFAILDGDFNFQVIMRGPILDIINGPGLTENPDPRLASYDTPGFSSVFQICRPTPNCSELEIFGQVESVSRVPEPHTLGLLGLGMLGLAATSRRKSRAASRQAE